MSRPTGWLQTNFSAVIQQLSNIGEHDNIFVNNYTSGPDNVIDLAIVNNAPSNQNTAAAGERTRGIPENILAKLGTFQFTDADLEPTDCIICCEDFTPHVDMRRLPCGGGKHIFHKTCIDHWLAEHNNCPVCRESVLQDPELVREYEEYLRTRSVPDEFADMPELIDSEPHNVQSNIHLVMQFDQNHANYTRQTRNLVNEEFSENPVFALHRQQFANIAPLYTQNIENAFAQHNPMITQLHSLMINQFQPNPTMPAMSGINVQLPQAALPSGWGGQLMTSMIENFFYGISTTTSLDNFSTANSDVSDISGDSDYEELDD